MMNENLMSCAPKASANAHFDFKLDGWPAAVAIMSICFSSVAIYGINAWSKTVLTA